MKTPPTIFLALLLTFCSTSSQQAPAYSRQYELGSTYSYSYETIVLLNDRSSSSHSSSSKNVGFKLGLLVDVSPVWQNPSQPNDQIFELKVHSSKLYMRARQGTTGEEFVEKPSKVESGGGAPFFFHRNGGVVEETFFANNEDPSWVNLKKGISSIFQYQEKEGAVEDVVAGGRCQAHYHLQGGDSILTKEAMNCSAPSNFPFFKHSQRVLGADVSRKFLATYNLDTREGGFQSCSVTDVHHLKMSARKASEIEVFSSQRMDFKGKSGSKTSKYDGSSPSQIFDKISKAVDSPLVKESLLTVQEDRECIACKSLKDLVNSFRKALSPSNLAKQSSAVAFVRILKKMRLSDPKEIKALFTDKKNANIMNQLLDLAAAAQTWPAYEAAKSSFDFLGSETAKSERFLLSLALSTHPSQEVIEDLMRLSKKSIRNPKMQESFLLSLASVTKTFASFPENDQKIVQTVLDSFLVRLSNCKDESCILTNIRALGNLQQEAAIPKLIQFAKGKKKNPAIYAMRAIQTMPESYIDDKVKADLEAVLFELESRHDSTVRSMAAEILLRWPFRRSVLVEILKMFENSTKGSSELHTLLWNHIQDLTEKDPRMAEVLVDTLKTPDLMNWNILSHGGLSSAFSRPLVNVTTEGPVPSSSAFFRNMLEINGGILKRSYVDVFIGTPDEAKTNLLSIGMFAGGLSLFGGDETADDSAEEAHAGIEIGILGSQLRPFVFFTGQGELMGHVWSGTASERTTALQGSFLLQDHREMVSLSNGMNLEFSLTGSLTYDFAGQVQISLWNQNAHSLVEVGSAVMVQGQARVESSFVQSMVEFNSGAETRLDFVSDLTFSDDIALCLRMMQPSYDFIDTVRKFERVPGNKYVLRKYKKRSQAIPGKTFVMNRKNTEICTKMFRAH